MEVWKSSFFLYRESRKTNNLNLKSTEKVNQCRERQIGKIATKKETDGYMTKREWHSRNKMELNITTKTIKHKIPCQITPVFSLC
jgi:hypothetical protein